MAEKTVEQLQAELNEANSKIVALTPEVAEKKKPYTAAEIAAHTKSGHVIGLPHQKLSLGHDEADLQKWDMWVCELKLKLKMIPELGKERAVPDTITPLRIVKNTQVGNDRTFQEINKQTNFREHGAADQVFYFFPTGSVEAGKTYECNYWMESVGKGIGATDIERMDVKAVPKFTGKKTA